MKILFLLLCLSPSAFGTTLTCSARLEGTEILKDSIEVTDDGSELYLGNYKEVDLVGRAVMGQVTSAMIFDGVLFGSIGMSAASYTMYILGEGKLTLDCALDDSVLP